MISLLFTAIFPAAVLGLSRNQPILIDPVKDCQFTLRSAEYDLCPIFSGAAVQWPLLVKSPPEADAAYRFHLGNDLEGFPGDVGDRGNHCPPGTRVCLSTSQPESEAMSISSGSLVSAYHFEDSLYLHWEGGYEGRAVLIELICDPKESGYPTFSNATGTLHVFTWRTKYGCSLDTFHALDSESEQPPADANPEPSDTDEEQLLEGSKQMNSRRSTAIVFLVASTIIITLSIISYKHPRMFNLLLTEYIKPVFHRLPLDIPPISIPNLLKPTGEGRLVRWAQEDLELDEDFVNAHDAEDDVEAGGLDEYIPLRPSPRKGGRSVKNYGSATSPFW